MRQVFYSSPWIHEPEPEELFRIYAAYGERIKVKAGVDLPVSYTHLTLPTICSV